jgi:mannose-6-phosphate isomerase-like protein (cupin superfamily)
MEEAPAKKAMEYSEARHLKLSTALAAIPTSDGRLFANLFRHGSLQVEIYAPRGVDLQQPHTRDEVYVVASGTGWFINGDKRMQFSPGDVLFAAAGEVHKFADFSTDFVVWVLFYGPEGGESGGK